MKAKPTEVEEAIHKAATQIKKLGSHPLLVEALLQIDQVKNLVEDYLKVTNERKAE